VPTSERKPAPYSRAFLLQPREWARGRIRAGIEAIQAELLVELQALDADVERLVARRTEIVDDLRRCRDAFGAGCKWVRRVPLPGDVAAVPTGTRLVAGRDLAEVLREILCSAERPMGLSELHRSVLAHGWHVEGRPSHTLSNALRSAVVRGEAIRVRPGVYAAASYTSSSIL
jgi:hypothetical protein